MYIEYLTGIMMTISFRGEGFYTVESIFCKYSIVSISRDGLIFNQLILRFIDLITSHLWLYRSVPSPLVHYNKSSIELVSLFCCFEYIFENCIGKLYIILSGHSYHNNTDKSTLKLSAWCSVQLNGLIT